MGAPECFEKLPGRRKASDVVEARRGAADGGCYRPGSGCRRWGATEGNGEEWAKNCNGGLLQVAVQLPT